MRKYALIFVFVPGALYFYKHLIIRCLYCLKYFKYFFIMCHFSIKMTHCLRVVRSLAITLPPFYSRFLRSQARYFAPFFGSSVYTHYYPLFIFLRPVLCPVTFVCSLATARVFCRWPPAASFVFILSSLADGLVFSGVYACLGICFHWVI